LQSKERLLSTLGSRGFRQRLKQMMAWVLIIVMMVPNVSFGEDLGHSIMVGIRLPNDSISTGTMDHVTLKVYSDNAGEVGGLVTSFELKDESNWQIELNNQTAINAEKYWLVASAAADNYFLLDSDPVELDLTAVTEPIVKNVLLKSPVMTGTIYMPDGVTPILNGTTVTISPPHDALIITDGVYSCNVWYMGQTNPMTYFADVTQEGLMDSEAVQLLPSDFTNGTRVQNFTLRDANQPFTIANQGNKHFPITWHSIPFSVEFENQAGTSASDFEAALYSYDGTNYSKTQDLVLKDGSTPEFRNSYGNIYEFRADYSKTGVSLISGTSIFVGLTDTVKNQTIYAQMTPVSSPIFNYAARVGFSTNGTLDTYYHKLEANQSVEGTFNVTVYDASDVEVGSGTAEIFNEKISNYLMRTTVATGSEPAYFVIENMMPFNENADNYNVTMQSDNFLWRIVSDSTQHKIEFHNDAMTADTINALTLTSHSAGLQFDLSMTDAYTKDAISDADLPTGIRYSIPVDEIASKSDYTISYTTQGGAGSSLGFISLIDPNASIYEVTVKEPTGTTALTEVFASLLPNKGYPPIQYTCTGGVFRINSAQDGDYEFVFSSLSQDDYSVSQPIYFRVVGGVVTAYSDAERTTALSVPASVNLQEGLYAGKAFMTDGITPASNLTILAQRWISNGPSVSLFNMAIKPDGSVYVPKADEVYTLILVTFALPGNYVGQANSVTVSSQAIDSSYVKDVVLVKEQFRGTFFNALGLPLGNHAVNLIVRDNQGQPQSFKEEFTYDGTNYNYKMGGLPAGDYTIEIEPQYSIAHLYSNSDPVEFTIDTNGVSNLLEINLTFKTLAEAPFTLEQNLLNNFPTEWDNINVDVELRGFGVTDPNEFIVKLYSYDAGTQAYTLIRPLTLAPNTQFQFFNSYDQVHRFIAEYTKQVGDVTPGTMIYVGITDPVKEQTIYVSMMPVTVPVIWNANFLGFKVDDEVGATHNTFYHKLGTTDSNNDYAPVVVKDSGGVVVGQGVVNHVDPRFGDSVMVTQVEKGKQPATYQIADTAFANANAGEFKLNPQTHSFILKTYSDETNHYVDFYNEDLTVANITKLDLVSDSKGPQMTLSQTDKFSTEIIQATADLPGGVRYIIPIAKIASADDYIIHYQTPQSSGSIGYYNLLDPNASILDVVVKDPTGNTQINSVFADFAPNGGYAYSQFDVVDGVFKLREAEDGHYAFIFSSTGDDTYAVSMPLNIWVSEGKVYSDEALITEVTSLQVNLQQGVLAGKAYDHLGNPAVDSFVWVDKIEADFSWTSLYTTGIKPNGSIYLPKVDGDFALSLNQGKLEGKFLSDLHEVQVVGSEVVETKELHLVKEQVRGLILDPNGISIVNHGYMVKIFDQFGNEMVDGFTSQHWFSEGNDMFVLGGLAPGNYAIKAVPAWENESIYLSSNLSTFTIDQGGNASSPQLDLQFKVKADLPLNIVKNDTLCIQGYRVTKWRELLYGSCDEVK